jgi:hypothetical protein
MKYPKWKTNPRMSLAQANILIEVARGTPLVKANDVCLKPLNILLRKGYVKLIGAEHDTLGVTIKGHKRIEKAEAIIKAWDALQTMMTE